MEELVRDFIKKHDCIGICGPQGSGKTTLCNNLRDIAVTLSIDDFYFPATHLRTLGKTGNPFYEMRGLPGTHDIGLLEFAMKSLKSNSAVNIPQFDKSLNEGFGDRRDTKLLNKHANQALLLEGWFIGFLPSSIEQEIWFTQSDVDVVNSELEKYSKIWKLLDAIIDIQVTSLEWIEEWRYEQEVNKKQGMDKQDIHYFVSKFLPWYKCNRYREIPTLLIILDKNRNVVHYEVL